MELALRQAKARLSELVAAVQSGERVIITKHGEPAVELVRFRRRGGIDFEKLDDIELSAIVEMRRSEKADAIEVSLDGL